MVHIVQKEIAQKQISQLLNATTPFLHEPTIECHKGRPSSSKSKGGTSSTRRDPSAFEIVEKTRKCSICKGACHNSRSCQYKVNDVGLTVDSMISSTNHGGSTRNIIDLNTSIGSINDFFWD